MEQSTNQNQEQEQQKEMTTEAEEKEAKKNSFDPYAPHKIKWWGWPLLIALIFGTIYIYRQQHPQEKANENAVAEMWTDEMTKKAEGSVFGTFYHITYCSTEDLAAGISETLDKVNNSLSPFNKQSTITAINENKNMGVDSMFESVFNLAKEVSAETDGAFDITVAPLVNLWGFGFKTGEKVSDKTVDSLRQFVGFSTVKIENGKVVKEHPETMLDCSAIAKGYGVDAVGEYLESKNIHSYMVEIGGEVRLRGHNPKGENWSIGVAKPEDDALATNNEMQQVIKTTDISMATSGNYRNFYVKDGKKYAHTIDPRTGYPVQHNILSSTVLAKDCATADAYATSFMVLGLDGAKKVLAKHKELIAYFIYADDKGNMCDWYSDGMKEYLQR